MASATLKKVAHYKGFDAEIKKLERSLLQIQDLLADASQKVSTNQSVKRWLNDLQHLAYDIDDVLDDLATEAMHREFTHKSEPITSKVTKLIPVCCKNFSRNHDELDDIMARLQDLLEKKGHLGLSVKEETRSKDVNRRLQTSMVDASSIVGRQAEKEALVQKLLQDEESDKNFSIVPIVGMGGVGKTTLARLLYNEQQVKDRFELKAWVCVSDEFDSFAIRLSYQDLSARVKQLFAYCSLFPKNYVFDKETLVQLWIAEGFLQQSTSSDSEKECFGHECFDELLSRSFFQHAPNNESLFVMHDLMNDLTTSVAGEFLLRVENNTREEALEKYRHMSFICERYAAYKKFEPYKRANSLRTFMALPFGVVEERYFFLSDKILVDFLNYHY